MVKCAVGSHHQLTMATADSSVRQQGWQWLDWVHCLLLNRILQARHATVSCVWPAPTLKSTTLNVSYKALSTCVCLACMPAGQRDDIYNTVDRAVSPTNTFRG